MATNAFLAGDIIEGTYEGKPYRYRADEDYNMGSSSWYGRGTDLLNGDRKVFLKKYMNPTKLSSWFESYVAYQAELKRRIDTNSDMRQCVYELYNFFIDEKNRYCQVLEFIDGAKDLKAYLEQPGTTWGQRQAFARVFMHSMDVLHRECKTVHADLKPENLLLIPNGENSFRLKLIDLDRPVLTDWAEIPWEGEEGHLGTPGYFSPEHLRGQRPTEKSDIFTCGIILHEILTKKHHPFNMESSLGIYDNYFASEQPPKLLASFGSPELDEEISRMLHRCLDPNPENRPTAQELHQVLIRRPTLVPGMLPISSNTDMPVAANPIIAHRQPGVADIVFLVDSTGSMKHCIDTLNEKLTFFFRQLASEGQVTDWRARVVGFRDFAYDEAAVKDLVCPIPGYNGWLEDNPFTRSIDELREQLENLNPCGGGPNPKESLLEALYVVANSGILPVDTDVDALAEEDWKKWRHRGIARIVVVFTDADYQDVAFKGTVMEMPESNVINHLIQKRIVMFLYAPSVDGDRDLERVPRALVQRIGNEIETGFAGLDFSKVLDKLVAGISSSTEGVAIIPKIE